MKIAMLAPDQPAAASFYRTGTDGEGTALVVEGDRLVGIVSESDLHRLPMVADLSDHRR